MMENLSVSRFILVVCILAGCTVGCVGSIENKGKAEPSDNLDPPITSDSSTNQVDDQTDLAKKVEVFWPQQYIESLPKIQKVEKIHKTTKVDDSEEKYGSTENQDAADEHDQTLHFEDPEVEALLAQPYVDPLTRYLQRYADDPTRAMYMELIKDERMIRCREAAEKYEKLPKTAANLEKMRAGYEFSCPKEVEDFAALVTDLKNSDCYLLTKLHNYREALEPCLVPANNGDVRAQLNMAVIARELQQYAAAFHWARLAAKHFPEGNYLVGELYAEGQGVEQSDIDAAHWYGLAAQQGHARAQAALGKLYLSGKGVVTDPAAAKAWLLKAARQNDADALFCLGKMCEHDKKAPDPLQAMVWYDLASQNGGREAKDRLVKLNGTVDTTKISQAQAKVRRALKGKSQ